MIVECPSCKEESEFPNTKEEVDELKKNRNVCEHTREKRDCRRYARHE